MLAGELVRTTVHAGVLYGVGVGVGVTTTVLV